MYSTNSAVEIWLPAIPCYIDAFFPEEVQWSCLFSPLIEEFNEIFYWESLMRSE